MKVGTCPRCDTPTVEGYEESTSTVQILDLREVEGGTYELVGAGLMRPRLTTKGQLRRGGKGLRPHAPNCPAVKADAAKIATARNARGIDVPQSIPEPEPAPPKPPPAVLIEIQDLLGPQDDTGYVDWTGHPLGRTLCGACGQRIIVAAHHHRPNGERPVLLIDRAHPAGPWRVYVKAGITEPRAEFRHSSDPAASHHNHRVVCPKARPMESD